MVCSRCGTKNPQDSENCFNCGRNISVQSDVSGVGNDTSTNGHANGSAAKAFRDQTSKLEDENYRRTALIAPMQLFFFTAVDPNGKTRFFDIMQGEDYFSVAETATTAPRLAQCRETVFEVPKEFGIRAFACATNQ